MRGRDQTMAVGVPLAALILWEILVRTGQIDARFFPAPSAILLAVIGMIASGELFNHLQASAVRIICGFLLGAVPGIALGTTMGLFPPIRTILNPLVMALFPVPKLAILPLVLLIFGVQSELSKYVIIGLGTFFLVLVNTMAGVINIDKRYLEVARNFQAGTLDFYRTVAIPGAMPMILAGCKLGMGTALLLIVAAEFVATQKGIGYMIWFAWQTFAIPKMYAGIIIMSLLGILLSTVLDLFQRWIAPWSPSSRGAPK